MNKITITVVSALLIFSVLSAGTAFGRDAALIVQASPPNGGSVSPGLGVHKMESGSDISLSATPKPGYQFVYWLGDVASSDSSSTSAYLDSPKIVVAVFERSEYDFIDMTPEDIKGTGRGPVGGGGLLPDYRERSAPVTGGGGGVRPEYDIHQHIHNWPDPNDDTDNGDDIDTPDVPEPSTMLLLGAGAFALLKRRREK